MTQYAEPWKDRIGVPESFVALDPDHDLDALPGGQDWGPFTDSLRKFLDAVATSVPGADALRAMRADLDGWTRELAGSAVPERDRAFGHRVDLVGRGQVMAPWFEVTERAGDSVRGTVRFGPYFLGGHGAVHGGAVALLLDEVLGRLCDTGGRPPARTAALDVSFRAITPVDETLDIHAWYDEEVGRKRVLRGEVWHGEVLCAEARGLFLSLLAGQE